MSHRHWCDYAGHYWECFGTAIRLFRAEPSVCMCIQHAMPMEQGDHSACSIELLSCPEHRADHMRAMGHDPDYVIPSSPEDTEPSSLFRDAEGRKTIGFCLWCGCDFYTIEEHEAHIADDMAACLAFQELKDEHCMPPVLQQMLEDVGPIESADQE